MSATDARQLAALLIGHSKPLPHPATVLRPHLADGTVQLTYLRCT